MYKNKDNIKKTKKEKNKIAFVFKKIDRGGEKPLKILNTAKLKPVIIISFLSRVLKDEEVIKYRNSLCLFYDSCLNYTVPV